MDLLWQEGFDKILTACLHRPHEQNIKVQMQFSIISSTLKAWPTSKNVFFFNSRCICLHCNLQSLSMCKLLFIYLLLFVNSGYSSIENGFDGFLTIHLQIISGHSHYWSELMLVKIIQIIEHSEWCLTLR